MPFALVSRTDILRGAKQLCGPLYHVKSDAKDGGAALSSPSIDFLRGVNAYVRRSDERTAIETMPPYHKSETNVQSAAFKPIIHIVTLQDFVHSSGDLCL